jgi:hypothetical protein
MYISTLASFHYFSYSVVLNIQYLAFLVRVFFIMKEPVVWSALAWHAKRGT